MDKFPKFPQKLGYLDLLNILLKKVAMSAVMGFVALVILLNGCSPMTYIKQVSQSAIAFTRKEGEKMVYGPEKTQEQYSCTSVKRVILKLEEVEVLPELISPGKEINHRIRYALCPFPDTGIYGGNIIRVVRFNQKEVFRDVSFYQFKPGTWIIDAFIGIPKEARGGTYTIETTMRYKRMAVNDKRSITVVEK